MTSASSPRRLPRRALLLGAAAATLAAGCGPVRLGQPQPYDPPPPGIDELYRADLLALLRSAAAEELPSDPLADDVLRVVRSALPVQITAMMTGAEAQAAAEASDGGATGTADPSDPATGSTAPLPPPRSTQEMAEALVAIRSLCTDAARQVSGSLARPMLSIGAFATWASTRLAAVTAVAPASPLPADADVVPAREVPASDPPTVGAETDFFATLESAQQDEWYAGYAHEVLAAQTEDAQREALVARAAENRDRAERLGQIAQEEGAPVVLRAAVYPIPGGVLTAELAASLPLEIATTLLRSHLALVGAAPFERRPLPIVAALRQAELLAGMLAALEPLPSLSLED